MAFQGSRLTCDYSAMQCFDVTQVTSILLALWLSLEQFKADLECEAQIYGSLVSQQERYSSLILIQLQGLLLLPLQSPFSACAAFYLSCNSFFLLSPYNLVIDAFAWRCVFGQARLCLVALLL